MALPKLDTPTYQLELPSNQQVIKYRPFLVKEQKILMMAQDADNKKDTYDMLSDIVDGCTFNSVDIKTMPVFDFEYLFLKIRCKSVGESAEISVLCPDDNKTRVPKIIMRYPTIDDIRGINEIDTTNNVMNLLKSCIHEVHDGDNIHSMIDVTRAEIDEFIDSLPTDVFEKISVFFDTMPQLTHVVEVDNPETGAKNEIVIQGMESFFS